jgi:ribosome maturation factor RimP
MYDIDAAIYQKIERLVTQEGYELVHVEFKFGSGNRILRVFLDRPGGITLDDCQNISQQISTSLDVEDPYPQGYILEVSSPGLDRRLCKETDYIRFVGRRIRLSLRQPVGGRRKYRGKLVAAGDGVLRLVEPGQGEWVFSIDSIEKANLEIKI